MLQQGTCCTALCCWKCIYQLLYQMTWKMNTMHIHMFIKNTIANLHILFSINIKNRLQPTFVIAENLHAWLCVWIVSRLETYLLDTYIKLKLFKKQDTKGILLFSESHPNQTQKRPQISAEHTQRTNQNIVILVYDRILWTLNNK